MLVTVPFFLSAIFLVAFVFFRSWEESHGSRIFQERRLQYDEYLQRMYHALVMGNIPTEWRLVVFAFLHTVLHQVVLLSVELLRAIERPLARLSYRMRMQTPQKNGKEVSAFLKTIAPEKKADSGQTEGGV